MQAVLPLRLREGALAAATAVHHRVALANGARQLRPALLFPRPIRSKIALQRGCPGLPVVKPAC
jgi:hypothetical protein